MVGRAIPSWTNVPIPTGMLFYCPQAGSALLVKNSVAESHVLRLPSTGRSCGGLRGDMGLRSWLVSIKSFGVFVDGEEMMCLQAEA